MDSINVRESLIETLSLAIERLYSNIREEIRHTSKWEFRLSYESPNYGKYIREEKAIRTTLTVLGITHIELKSYPYCVFDKLTELYDWLHWND